MLKYAHRNYLIDFEYVNIIGFLHQKCTKWVSRELIFIFIYAIKQFH